MCEKAEGAFGRVALRIDAGRARQSLIPAGPSFLLSAKPDHEELRVIARD